MKKPPLGASICLAIVLMLGLVFAITPPAWGSNTRPEWTKPSDVVIHGNTVFKDPATVPARLEGVLVYGVPSRSSIPPPQFDIVYEAQFSANNRIELAPLRSSHSPRYTFQGSWSLDSNGEMDIIGRFQPAFEAEALPENVNRAPRKLHVRNASVSTGALPNTYSLRLELLEQGETK